MSDATVPSTSSPADPMPQIYLRPPSHSAEGSASTLSLPIHTFVPPVDFLRGNWHVTHSSLPMWKKAQNVSITYTVLSLDSTACPTFDNLVEYQSLGASDDNPKKTIKGVEAPRHGVEGAWRWRGKGWLMIASSDWEVLGYGRSNAVGVGGPVAMEERREDDWCVTYFAKTLFTPSGIDVYCRQKQGLDEAVLGEIKEALKDCGEEVHKLGQALFEVKRA